MTRNDPEQLIHPPKTSPGHVHFAEEPTDTIPHGMTTASSLTREITVRAGGVVGPQDAAPVMTEMSLKDFYQNGVLWWINHALLYDLGLALAVEVLPLQPNEGENSRVFRRLYVQDFIPPQRILDPDDANWYELFQRWLSNRAGTVRS